MSIYVACGIRGNEALLQSSICRLSTVSKISPLTNFKMPGSCLAIRISMQVAVIPFPPKGKLPVMMSFLHINSEGLPGMAEVGTTPLKGNC